MDRDFNVNVNTEADGALLHGIGGTRHRAGATHTIISQPLPGPASLRGTSLLVHTG
jgi:citrate lyase subunit alpha/citrate CoA-transferase